MTYPLDSIKAAAGMLRNGEATDFGHALVLCQRQYLHESNTCSGEEGDDTATWDGLLSEAQIVARIYWEHIRKAEAAVIQELYEQGFSPYAEALQKGSYEELAI